MTAAVSSAEKRGHQISWFLFRESCSVLQAHPYSEHFTECCYSFLLEQLVSGGLLQPHGGTDDTVQSCVPDEDTHQAQFCWMSKIQTVNVPLLGVLCSLFLSSCVQLGEVFFPFTFGELFVGFFLIFRVAGALLAFHHFITIFSKHSFFLSINEAPPREYLKHSFMFVPMKCICAPRSQLSLMWPGFEQLLLLVFQLYQTDTCPDGRQQSQWDWLNNSVNSTKKKLEWRGSALFCRFRQSVFSFLIE